MTRIKFLLFLLALGVQVPLASGVTYAVGTCAPSLTSFTTITRALGAIPAPNVVEVCPGTYNEQVVISFPVTLEGISTSNAAQATIAVPTGGLVPNASDDSGHSLAVQVLLQNAGGEVNLSDLTVEGSGNGVTSSSVHVAGVFYQNSPGTINHLTVQDQNGNGLGVGIWLEGGSANPSVTVENSNVQSFDDAGIYAETNSAGSELTATVQGNYLAALANTSLLPTGIDLVAGLTASITGNSITGAFDGVLIDGGKGSVSKNKVVSNAVGIDLETDGVAVTTNTIYTTGGGFDIGIVANSAVAAVTGNIIVTAPIGIFFDCVAGKNVHSNTILGSGVGLYGVPTGTVGTNTYYNVGTINGGGC
jgi:hypothetical protein